MDQTAKRLNYIVNTTASKLHDLVSYSRISGLKHARAIKHVDLGEGFSDAEGNVVPLEMILAQHALSTKGLPQDHFDFVYDVLKDEKPAVLDRAMELMVEYELLHHARVDIQKAAGIEYREFLRDDPFYHDIPGHQIAELDENERQKKKDEITKVRYLHLIESAYANVLGSLFHEVNDWKDFGDYGFKPDAEWLLVMEKYEANRAAKRARLLNDPNELELELQKEIAKMLRINI